MKNHIGLTIAIFVVAYLIGAKWPIAAQKLGVAA